MPTLPASEEVVFGHRIGEPKYTEILLLSSTAGVNLEKALEMMRADGWVPRVAKIDLTRAPDFARTINR